MPTALAFGYQRVFRWSKPGYCLDIVRLFYFSGLLAAPSPCRRSKKLLFFEEKGLVFSKNPYIIYIDGSRYQPLNKNDIRASKL